MAGTSDRAVVWAWLPGADEPAPVGSVGVPDRTRSTLAFSYASSFLARADAIPIGPDLPLDRGTDLHWPPPNHLLAGTLRDAMPDAWGRRVLFARNAGLPNPDDRATAVGELRLMLTSGSNRFGALDFQATASSYAAADSGSASLEDLHRAATLVEAGVELPADLGAALQHGTTIGGARPKALIDDGDEQWIAKFASSNDLFPVVQAEAMALDLAGRAGIGTPQSRVVESLGRATLLVRRFDRLAGGRRRMVVSGLTLVGLPEDEARYATYPALLDRLREHGDASAGTELFSRIAFNMAISNSDDHARNHAAFWDGSQLELTPAYDLAPGPRSGSTASQAMEYADGRRESRLSSLLDSAGVFGLTTDGGRGVIDRILDTIVRHFDEAAEAARLTAAQRTGLLGAQFLNPGIGYGYGGYRPPTWAPPTDAGWDGTPTDA